MHLSGRGVSPVPTPPRSAGVPPPHETIGAIPNLDSAPPSGNFDPLLHTNPLPLPPPPPPPPRMKTSTSTSASPPRTITPPSSSSSSSISHMVPLPPPPLRLPPRTTAVGATTTTATPPAAETEEATTAPPPTMEDLLAPPAFLPITTFGPRSLQMLARRQTHIPILVIATEQANRLAWKNNLQLIDLFQGIVHELRVGQMPPFRSIYKSLLPTTLKANFVEPSQLNALSLQSAHELLNENAKLQDADGNVAQELVLLEDRVDELLQDRNNNNHNSANHHSNKDDNNNYFATTDNQEPLEQVTKDAYNLTSPLDIPWLLRYRHALDVSTNALPHDLINCPPLVLLVCTTQEIESPEEVLQELYNSPHVLPDPFKNGLYDPQSLRREVLVLHDAVDGPKDLEEVMLRQSLISNFGNNAAVLRINSVLPETAKALAAQEDTDLWGGNGTKGNCLSVNDRVLLRRYFQTLLTTALLPALERRISDLNAIVSERKKGVRNLVKSFWRKPKEETPPNQVTNTTAAMGADGTPSSAAVKYRFDTIESQTRLLADTLFLMQDYEASLSIYRLIRDDYKSDKALTYYANVQEMMALCLYHMDPYTRSKEIFGHLETALLSYTRAADEERSQWGTDPTARPSTAPHATRLATRLCLLLAAASDSLTKGRELEVADLLASASSHESSLGAAVLLEQSSSFYYHAGMYRKYAFHMLMSGHMFRTAGQDNHAFRCFTSALYVYRHGQWNELHNHLRSALAAQLYTMGRMSVALVLYAKLVGTSSGAKVSPKSQHKFLAHLQEICELHPKSALAGADRMASPPTIPSNEREAFRNAQLERIVQVIRYTKGASRVLELPYMNLPQIVDKSVRIWTHAEEHFIPNDKDNNNEEGLIDLEEEHQKRQVEQSMAAQFGKVSKGNDNTWNELQWVTTAELNAVDFTRPQLDKSVTAALAKISDLNHRKVIAQLDKEKANRNLLERSKRNGSVQPSPTIRARGEPLFCDVTVKNPLAVDIQLTEMQLVARMVDASEPQRTCTNQDAVRIKTLLSDEERANGERTWTFASTGQATFSVAEFCRCSVANQNACTSAKETPFFVVTKRPLELPAGAERTVSAGLAPLVEGNLEILGLRFKLFDKVWVYHPFDIPGPLLQNSRTNRADRVRGESMVLKSKIEVDMPCLTAELVKRTPKEAFPGATDGGPLLEGQISAWAIRLHNVGNAPATRVTLKTNLPWVNIVASSPSSSHENEGLSVEQREAQATSRCVGPTGTLITLPIKGGDGHINDEGAIYPGESVEIPIQIRTSGSGKQEFYMLYRYELLDPENEDNASRPRHRWLRKMYEVPVFPSLSLTAKVVTSFWNGKEQLVSVQLTNNRTDRPTDLFITLDRLSLASRHYRLEALPGQFSTSEQAANVLQIGWQERITAHYRVIPLDQESRTCLLSECSFTEKANCYTRECVASEATDYLCLERACETFEASWKSHQLELARAEQDDGEGQHPRSIASIRRANTSDTADTDSGSTMEIHPTSIGKLCPPETSASKIHVICSWRAILGDEVIHGEHHLRGVSIRPLTFFNGCPVTATATHPAVVSHDFSIGPAIVPMQVALRNRMLESPVKFYVSVEQPSTFELIGLDMLRLSLEANEEINIPFEALISRAGVHNLQALQLTIRQDKEELSYRLQQQWLVTVKDSSSPPDN